MSIRARIRDRLDDIRDSLALRAIGVAAVLWGEPEIHAFTRDALTARDQGHFKAGVEFGKIQAGDPDLFCSSELVEE